MTHTSNKRKHKVHKNNQKRYEPSLYKKGVILWSFIPLLLISAPSVTAYAEGYRFIGGLVIQTGSMEVTSSEADSLLYVDGILQSPSEGKKEKFIGNLAPGIYEVVVLKKYFVPWKKRITVASGATTKFDAKLIPEDAVDTTSKINIR